MQHRVRTPRGGCPQNAKHTPCLPATSCRRSTRKMETFGTQTLPYVAYNIFGIYFKCVYVCVCIMRTHPKIERLFAGKRLYFNTSSEEFGAKFARMKISTYHYLSYFLEKKQEYYFSKLYEFLSLAFFQLHHKLACILYRRRVYMISYKK